MIVPFCRKVLVLSASLFVLAGSPANAQVPSEYHDLYWDLAVTLATFHPRVEVPAGASTTFSLELPIADANRGAALLNPETLPGVEIYLDRYAALGVQAVTVNIGYPMLLPAYVGASASAYVDFYRAVAASVRARGLQLIVKCGVLMRTPEIGAFYESVSDLEAYRVGRLQVAATVAREIAPDFLTLQAEPDTEASQTGHAVGDPAGASSFVAYLVSGLAPMRHARTALGAGAGTWYDRFPELLAAHAALPGLDYLDLHIYPIQRDWLDQALVAADIADAAGKRVAMSEGWLFKARDAELLYTEAMLPEIFVRDAYSFWEPLDAWFVGTVARMALARRFQFISPFWSKSFYAYAEYADVRWLPRDAVFRIIESAAAANLREGRLTAPGQLYRALAHAFGSAAAVPEPR